MTHLIDHTEHRRDYEQPLGLKTLTDGWVARLEQAEPARSGANANP